MQDDLISRQAVINSMANTNFWLSVDNWKELMKAIDSIPSVHPQPKIGHWIIIEELHGEWEGTKKYACDKCGEKVGVFKSNYCPNCGIKMESEDK